MKRRLLDRLYAALEWLLLLVDGHMPTQVRIKAVAKPATFIIAVASVERRLLVLSALPDMAYLRAVESAQSGGYRAALRPACQRSP